MAAHGSGRSAMCRRSQRDCLVSTLQRRDTMARSTIARWFLVVAALATTGTGLDARAGGKPSASRPGAVATTARPAAERARAVKRTSLRPARKVVRATFNPRRPGHQPSTRAIAGAPLSAGQSARLMQRVIAAERKFYQPGISYDGVTGMTYDGHPVDIRTGKPYALPRTWSAASKESLHLIMLVKAVEGDPVAQALLTPDPSRPEAAVQVALDVLARKIATYQRFDREYPGFGGFLPWYQVIDGKVSPTTGLQPGQAGPPAPAHVANWTYRVPGLDNGQLAWSLYHAANALRDRGHTKLANAYQGHVDKMKRNVVKIFYDRDVKQLRAEAKLEHSNQVPVEANRYSNNQAKYLLDDAYEGTMLVHFADSFGDWTGVEEGRDAMFATPRREPATYAAGTQPVSVVKGHWFSSHEDWGFMILPTRDLPIADRLFVNGQRARTQHAARMGHTGLFASTHLPVRRNTFGLGYRSAAGIQEIAKEPVAGGKPVFAPYAAFPLALTDSRLFASWLGSMLRQPGQFGELGIGESYSEDGKSSPVATWDGKALPMVAYMGGITSDIRRFLQRDGKYDLFMRRVKDDYRLFDKVDIKGEGVPFHAPPAPSGAAKTQPAR
jgi:hypothetical protein